MKKLLLILLLLGMSCNDTPPPVDPPIDPPVDPIDPPVDPPTDPPPPLSADPTIYIHVDRIQGILTGTNSQNPGLLHGMTFGGWRDPMLVANVCPWAASYLGFTVEGLMFFGETGMRLTREGEAVIIPQLMKENRRCDLDNRNYSEVFLKADGSCARSEMRKSKLKEYRSKLTPHLEKANKMRDKGRSCMNKLVEEGLARSPVIEIGYDSIAGFCQQMQKLEVDNPNSFCN